MRLTKTINFDNESEEQVTVEIPDDVLLEYLEESAEFENLNAFLEQYTTGDILALEEMVSLNLLRGKPQQPLFQQSSTLCHFTRFRDFEKIYDDEIFYADGDKQSVLNAVSEEPYAGPFEFYLFDGWYIALLSH